MVSHDRMCFKDAFLWKETGTVMLMRNKEFLSYLTSELWEIKITKLSFL